LLRLLRLLVLRCAWLLILGLPGLLVVPAEVRLRVLRGLLLIRSATGRRAPRTIALRRGRGLLAVLALLAVLTLLARLAVLSLLARLAVLTLLARLAVLTLLARLAVLTLLARLAVLTLLSGLTVLTLLIELALLARLAVLALTLVPLLPVLPELALRGGRLLRVLRLLLSLRLRLPLGLLLPLRRATVLDQLSEQRAVVHHPLPQLLGRGLALLRESGDVVALAVVVQRVGVVDGQQTRLLVEPLRRVAPLAHHRGHEIVGLGHGGLRVVDEPRLHLLPRLLVPLPRRRVEGADLQLRPLLVPLGELTLRLRSAALLLHGAVVLRAVHLLEFLPTPCPSLQKEQDEPHE
jgi:hypothetical protein